MLVGEAPGEQEERFGIPFVGPTGNLLNEMLRKQGIERSSLYITNLVKCRPPKNRDPEKGEMDTCNTHFLSLELAAVSPAVIIAVGRFAAQRFLPGTEFKRTHGTPHLRDGRVILPVYHPAAALHNSAVRGVVERDCGALRAALSLSDRGVEEVEVRYGVAPAGGIIALDTEANIRDGKLVAVSTSKDGRIAYVSNGT
jgi:DNA polymerase